MTPINDFLNVRRKYLSFFCAINFCTGGLYVWSIFAVALAAKFSALSDSSVLPSDLSPIFGLASGITPLMMLAGGIVNDRFGPKWVIGAGGTALAAGYVLAALSSSTESLYFAYGILVGVGTGLVNGCTISTAVKYFPDRRGFAGGLVTASLGIGAAVLPFVANALIAAFGIEATLFAFAVFSAVVILPLSTSMRLAPVGFDAALAALQSGSDGTIRTTSRKTVHLRVVQSKDWRGMICTPIFWPLALLFMTSATLGLMILSNVSGIAALQAKLSAGAAAAAVSVISLANTAGRFVSGAASDAIGRLPALCVSLACALGGLLLLMVSGPESQWQFFVGLAGIGICFGAFIGIYPSLVTDEFGPKHNSVNFSILMLGYSVGGLAGPWLMKIAGSTGDFTGIYLMATSACCFGFLCAALYAFLKRRSAEIPVSATSAAMCRH